MRRGEWPRCEEAKSELEVLKLIIFHSHLIEERVILLKVPAVSNSTDIIQDRKHARRASAGCCLVFGSWNSSTGLTRIADVNF